MCGRCLIDEKRSQHRVDAHEIRILSEYAQETRYELERLYQNKFKSIHREVNDSVRFLAEILNRDQRLLAVFDLLEKQRDKLDQLEKLFLTLINYSHDIHVVLFQNQVRQTLLEVFYERPPRPRQGFSLNGIRFEPISGNLSMPKYRI